MRRLLRKPWVPLAAIVVLTVVAGFEISALGDSGSSEPEAPRASTRVAREFAVAITSFDHKRIDADVERVLAFGDDGFERTIGDALGDDFVQGVKRNKRVAVGTVLHGPTPQRVADGSAAFLVVVAQRIVSEGDTDDPPQALTKSMLVTVTTGDSPKVRSVEVL